MAITTSIPSHRPRLDVGFHAKSIQLCGVNWRKILVNFPLKRNEKQTSGNVSFVELYTHHSVCNYRLTLLEAFVKTVCKILLFPSTHITTHTSGHTCMWECSTCFASDKVSSSGTSTFSFPRISRIRCTQLHPLPTVKFSNNNFFLMFIDADCCAQLFPRNFCCQFRSHRKLWMLTIFVGTKLLKSDEKLTIF